ncbi:OmpH family outer membrane protein [Sphingomonas sp.]|uniref:OmpH family outer membrane protein n=1 Tax=Sphingomonas sp. TaxID=28214 RepID=UPI002FC94E71
MNKLVFGTAFAALAIAVPASAPAQRLGAAVVAVIDTARIFRECNACRTAQTQLQQQVDQARQRAQQLGQPIQTEGQSLENTLKALGGKAPDAALQGRIQAFQARQNTANQELQNRQATIQRNQQYVAQQINAKLDPIIKSVMQSRGANIAVDMQATLATSPSIDVTNDVLAQLNQQLTSVSVTAPAAPANAQQPQGR